MSDIPFAARHAILTGRAVVALVSETRHSHAMIDLAWTSGRHDDTRIVWAGPRRLWASLDRDEPGWAIPPESEWNGLPPLTDQGTERDFAPDDPEGIAYRASEDAAWAGRVPGPGLRLAKGNGDGPDRPHPDLAREDAEAMGQLRDPAVPLDLDGAAGKVLIVPEHNRYPHAGRYFLWLALALVERAERAGSRPPVIVGEARKLAVLSRILGWPVLERGNLSVCVPYRDPDAPRSGAAVEAMAEARIADRSARCTISCDDGVWIARGERRCVLAIPYPWDRSSDPRPAVLVVTMDDAGPRVASWLAHLDHEPDDEAMARLCRGSWLSTPATQEGVLKGKRSDAPLSDFLAEMIPSPSLARMRAIIAERLGPDWTAYHRAIARSPWSKGVTTWVQEPGGATERRRQFIVSYPALHRLAFDARITADVDAGRSPAPRLRALTGLPDWGLRRLAPQMFLPAGLENKADPAWRYQGALVAALGPDRSPARGDRLGWYWLSTRIRHLAPLADLSDGAAIATTARAVARLAAGPPPIRWRGLGEGVPFADAMSTEVLDFLRSLVRWLSDLPGTGVLTALSVAAEYGSLSDLYRASRLWHDEPRLSRAIVDVPPDATWPTPFDTVDLGDGCSAVALPDVDALAMEGTHGADDDGMDGLAHCVATYAPRCLAGLCAIVSLRGTTQGVTRRMSTAQLVLDPSGRHPKVCQHKGHGNVEPEEAAKAALERLLDGIASGDVPFDRSAFGFRRFDGAGREIRPADLFEVWRPILPPAWKPKDADDLAAVLRRRMEAMPGEWPPPTACPAPDILHGQGEAPSTAIPDAEPPKAGAD